MPEFFYAWPSSQLTPSDMRLLHDTREAHPDHPPITRLIAEAVRATYGQSAIHPEQVKRPECKPQLRAAA